MFLDLLATIGGERIAVELKYLVQGLSVTVDGERFELRSQAAQDIRRYDVIKDVCRLEEVLAAQAADSGALVALSNDPGYWKPGRPGTVDAAFRLQEGRPLAGALAWAKHAGAGTMKGREGVLDLAGSYALSWADFSKPAVGPGGQFRYLLIPVEGR